MAAEWILKKEKEGLILAAQEQALRRNSIKHSIDKTSETSLCRLCGESTEKVRHIVIGCKEDLTFEIKRIRGASKVTIIPIGTGALRSISKRAKTWYDKLGVPEFIGSVQLSAILGTAHFLRKMLCLKTAGSG